MQCTVMRITMHLSAESQAKPPARCIEGFPRFSADSSIVIEILLEFGEESYHTNMLL